MSVRQTLFDRLGPDAGLRLRLVGPSFIFFALIMVGLMRGGVSFWLSIPLALGGALVIAAIIARFSDAAGAGFLSFIWPSGSSTPYAKQYSLQESLAIRGDTAGAIAAYEAVIAEDPGDVEARVRVAELHASKGANPQRALEVFKDARRVSGITPERDLYISNRIIDLLRGPLGDEGRALVELRRMVQLHPGSRDASFARDAIAKMKVDSIKDSRDV